MNKKPKLTIQTMPSDKAPPKEKFAAAPDSALPQPDRSKYIYIVSENYNDAIEYMYAKDYWPGTTRWVSQASVLKGLERPQVVLLMAPEQVPTAIAEMLLRHNAQLTFDPTSADQGPRPVRES